jgi:hypothetical protein
MIKKLQKIFFYPNTSFFYLGDTVNVPLDIIGEIGSITNPASSGIELRELGRPTGNYYFRTRRGPIEAYVDMENDGGGWILYASFAVDNEYSQKALTKSRMLVNELNSNGFSLTPNNNFHDGVNEDFFYERREGWFAYYLFGILNEDRLQMDEYKGPARVTELKVRHGGGTVGYTGKSGFIVVNNSFIEEGQRNPDGTTLTITPFKSNGIEPLFKQVETGVAGISDIWIR